MPDIKSALTLALSKTITGWDDEKPTPAPIQPVSTSMPTKTFPIKNNISRTTFNYVRDNPGSTRSEIIGDLTKQGFNVGSTSSLLAQMHRSKLIHVTNGLHYADVSEYRPIKSLKAIRKQEVKEAPPMAASDGIAALHVDATPRKRTTILRIHNGPIDTVKHMTVYEARELYDHLKQLFGG